MGRLFWLPLLAALSASPASATVPSPQPPCEGAEPFPAYAAPGQPPTVAVWSSRALDDPGLPHVTLYAGVALETVPPPACSGWPELPFTVALSARFLFPGEARDLVARLADFSALSRAEYWAASRQRWEILLDEAYAVTDPDSRARRADVSAGEVEPGGEYDSLQNPAGPVGGAVYRMRIRELVPDRAMVELENITSARAAGLFPLPAGTLRSLYFLQRLPDGKDLWGYYALLGLWTTPDSARTYVNRAAALFRQAAGIPDRDQPVWP